MFLFCMLSFLKKYFWVILKMQSHIQKHALHFSDQSNTSHLSLILRQNQFTVPKSVIHTLSNFEGPDDNG